MSTFMISMVLLFILSAIHADSESCVMVAANNLTYLAIADHGEPGIYIIDSNSNVFACADGSCVKLANFVTLAAS
jgi:hypothetical protein